MNEFHEITDSDGSPVKDMFGNHFFHGMPRTAGGGPNKAPVYLSNMKTTAQFVGWLIRPGHESAMPHQPHFWSN